MMTEYERQQIDRRMRALEIEVEQLREVNRQMMDPIIRAKMLEPMPPMLMEVPAGFAMVKRTTLATILPQLHWNSGEYRELLALLGPEEGDQ